MNPISPCLWFDHQAEEAARFYTSIFKDSAILSTTYYGEDMPLPAGTVLTVTFRLNGQEFIALNGGPVFNFTPAISLHIACETQAEVDHYWDRLGDGGEIDECGWLKDKFGVSWQVVPTVLGNLMNDPNPAKAGAVAQAMLQMKKLDIAALKKAYDEA